MSKNLPKIIKDVGFDFDWDEKKVWALDLPVEEMEISELVWHFDIPFWRKPNGFYDLTPKAVLEGREEYEMEFQRIVNADLTYPLDIMFWKSRWLLLDGLHRLAKAFHEGQKKVKVRKVPVEMIERIKK